jgi:hypothetical protein
MYIYVISKIIPSLNETDDCGIFKLFLMFVNHEQKSLKNTKVVIRSCGAGTAYPSGAPELIPGF